jgi:Bacterial extracellular solute-binding protein
MADVPDREDTFMIRKSFLMLAMTVLTFAARAEGQLRIFVGGAMTEAVKKVDVDFAKKAGHRAEVTSDTSGALQKRIEAGGKADVLIISATNMSALEKEHLIVPRTRIDLAKDFIGVAVRVGAKAPNLSSPESFKEAMLAAKSVSYVGSENRQHIGQLLGPSVSEDGNCRRDEQEDSLSRPGRSSCGRCGKGRRGGRHHIHERNGCKQWRKDSWDIAPPNSISHDLRWGRPRQLSESRCWSRVPPGYVRRRWLCRNQGNPPAPS